MDDYISRQAAIDAVHNAWINGAYYTETINALKRLPSAQEQAENAYAHGYTDAKMEGESNE